MLKKAASFVLGLASGNGGVLATPGWAGVMREKLVSASLGPGSGTSRRAGGGRVKMRV
jgi:hypothetical protein